MGLQSPGLFNLLIGESYVTIFWLRFWVIFTEVGLRWVGYETHSPEPGNDSTEVERIRYARAYILEIIGGYLMLDLSRNLVHLRWLLKLVDFTAADELSWGSAMLATL
ncbi:hypothetical protein PVK06_020476 [Gossypium arboreum]|uniref:Aminotransferase-like plant mobile domain-containing protein n=1 Tax=Gossypium arboreum TaxID=29729 RepID=A0ABR0PMG8_GOSAR|nr:hypothetical protein PVK06_020476 [Gossypium arboreum]